MNQLAAISSKGWREPVIEAKLRIDRQRMRHVVRDDDCRPVVRLCQLFAQPPARLHVLLQSVIGQKWSTLFHLDESVIAQAAQGVVHCQYLIAGQAIVSPQGRAQDAENNAWELNVSDATIQDKDPLVALLQDRLTILQKAAPIVFMIARNQNHGAAQMLGDLHRIEIGRYVSSWADRSYVSCQHDEVRFANE
nr:hypothetical protein [Hypericibacter adhaerens]